MLLSSWCTIALEVLGDKVPSPEVARPGIGAEGQQFLSAGVSMRIAVRESDHPHVAKILICSSANPIGARIILIPSDVHRGIRPIGACTAAKLRCDGVSPVRLGILPV